MREDSTMGGVLVWRVERTTLEGRLWAMRYRCLYLMLVFVKSVTGLVPKWWWRLPLHAVVDVLADAIEVEGRRDGEESAEQQHPRVSQHVCGGELDVQEREGAEVVAVPGESRYLMRRVSQRIKGVYATPVYGNERVYGIEQSV